VGGGGCGGWVYGLGSLAARGDGGEMTPALTRASRSRPMENSRSDGAPSRQFNITLLLEAAGGLQGALTIAVPSQRDAGRL